ncbi:MAG: RdgB/HAM1 family non-canonical purine NTP pyrophosphatase [Rubrivivax sp.]|nr:RdgB/HAM1 family non-canonical purine NTP pyrophosphatase [Pyrinomonadaceae bacterium]
MNEPTELLVATGNAGKVRELSLLLADAPLTLRLLSDFPDIPEAEETGSTFAENATIKALLYSSRSGLLTLSDDSGLVVDALGGAPGVYSARYAGTQATSAERMAKLLGELAATGDGERRARFVCVIALADPLTGALDTFEGTCEGRITHARRGTGGFGYDPVFIPEGHEQTFGELPDEIKQNISHRARALAKAVGFLRERLPSRGLTGV